MKRALTASFALAVACSAWACATAPAPGGGAAAPRAQGARAGGSKASAARGAPGAAASAAPDLALAPSPEAVDKGIWWSPAKNPAPVTWLAWAEGGQLQVGFEDGQLATVDTQQRRGGLRTISEDGLPVLAVSPDGAQVMIKDDPLVLIGAQDTGIMLRMNQVPGATGVAWSPGGHLLVLDAESRIHVWEQIRARNAERARTLTELMQRQTPNYSFTFPASLGGSVAYTGEGLLVLGDLQGQVMLFDLHGDHMAWPLFEFEAPVHSLAVGQNYIMATSRGGEVRAKIMEPAKNLYWVRKQKALALAADPRHATWVGWVDAETISVRGVKRGEALWSRPRPRGSMCGVALDGGGERLAVCAGGVVGVFSARTGEPLAWLARQGDQISFAR